MAQVFISYKREDVDFAENVSNRLEREGFDVWADSKIAAGEEWRNAIDVAIGNSVAQLAERVIACGGLGEAEQVIGAAQGIQQVSPSART
jgi:TIR domain